MRWYMAVQEPGAGDEVAAGGFEAADKNLRKTMGFSHLLLSFLHPRLCI
jgi:hypothetical protein